MASEHPGWHLAELNIGRLHQPLDHPATVEFVAALDHVNALAEVAPGFVWRLTDESGLSSSYVRASDDPLEVINLSVWETLADLHRFVFRTGHAEYLRRRREWFQRPDKAFLVCWWVRAGHLPTVDEAIDRLARLRREGVSDDAFTMRDRRPAPAPVV